MKLLLMTTFLTLLSAKAQAQVIYDNCWDLTFAYNYMTVEKTADHYHLTLQGATIFNLAPNSWESNTTKSLKVPLDKCQASADDLLITCRNHDVDVVVDAPGTVNDKIIPIKDFSFNISYVEAVYSRGFNLKTRYRAPDHSVTMTSDVFFTGDRTKGCLQ